jgi:predicted transcriptional regulator
MTTVDDIIKSKPRPENIIQPTALVIDALRMLDQVNLSYLIVMDGNTYKGVFSERDYSRNVVLKGRSSSSTMVKDVMSPDLPEVSPEDSAEHCMNLITKHKSRYLVAYDHGHFAGIITIHDLLREVLANRDNVFDHSIAQGLIDAAEGRGRIY